MVSSGDSLGSPTARGKLFRGNGGVEAIRKYFNGGSVNGRIGRAGVIIIFQALH